MLIFVTNITYAKFKIYLPKYKFNTCYSYTLLLFKVTVMIDLLALFYCRRGRHTKTIDLFSAISDNFNHSAFLLFFFET